MMLGQYWGQYADTRGGTFANIQRMSQRGSNERQKIALFGTTVGLHWDPT